ncbi:MAG: P-II family nitrogen regulator [Oscillospiraceae bacterium]
MFSDQSQCTALALVVTVMNRGGSERLAEVFVRNKIPFAYLVHGKGTASTTILSYLGLGETEKDVVFAVMPQRMSELVLEEASHPERLGMPGKGIAFSMPINALSYVHGQRKLKAQICDNDDFEGGFPMKPADGYDLIIAITNQGYAEEVMEAAKRSGASGGTILHARGLGLKDAEKFFGISLQSEKEMVMMVVKSAARAKIEEAIIDGQGKKTEAMTIVFSVPVNGIAGIASLLPKPEEQPEL